MTAKTRHASPSKNKRGSKLRIGLVVPHIFMHEKLLPDVIFSPGSIALDLAEGLKTEGVEVTLFTPGPVKTRVRNINADLSSFNNELKQRKYGYLEMLKKHPMSFVSIARQVQSEIISNAYQMANEGKLDLVHVFTNEEDIAMTFSRLCNKPVVFTHHDPFNFLINYRNVFPKYKDLFWVSISISQRSSMPKDTNWVGNVYHGIPEDDFVPRIDNESDYLAYVGRIIEPKGLHLAIEAVNKFNADNSKKIKLKIAGKHYAGHKKDTYWKEVIEPFIDDKNIEYLGFLDKPEKNDLFANAKATIIPSVFEEPFGMVAIESLACATPVIALNSGALPEIIEDGLTGVVAKKTFDRSGELDKLRTSEALEEAISRVDAIDRKTCRDTFVSQFSVARMAREYKRIYELLS